MDDKGSDEADVYAAEKSTPETDKSEKVEPEKELCNGDDDRLSQLRDEESLETTDSDKEDLHDQTLRETLAKDQVEGVRENSAVESNGEDIGEVKEKASGNESVVSAIVPVDEVTVENPEVETSTGLTVSLNPSMVEPSLSSNPSAAHGVSLVSIPSKQDQISDSRVVSNLSVSPVLRTPARDGYNWRKYGQKQVKSPKGSRSYYRCTYSDCCAKKIECSNDSGNVIEIVNKGLHSHEPPRKNSFSPREIRAASVIPPVSEDNTVEKDLALVPCDPAPSTSTRENTCQSLTIVERKKNCENEAVEEPEPKRRLKRDNTQSSDSVSKPGKKLKFVVHAAGDVGISGDGYRWRKYGQKMVKGNPNPRNYYRCTSAGCPVRKHIETAVENTTAIVITYKGVHNHDMPVPKKRHGPPSSVLVAAAAPTSMRTRSDDQVNIPSSSQCSVGREGEKQSSEAVDVGGGEKVMESARTLLSIGFEIKQC
uniref:WRKY3 transcription factor n=1 Tax=Isatis tinctoria TaxID=161756 RepID=A0A6G8R7F8_ISATI|nr:WRKY3 transcription factor [Isatis tinctoria]